jgi:hypothetical protein
MFLFIFIYLFTIKYIIRALFGNYRKSLSSYVFIPLIYLNGDTVFDILVLTLSLLSSIHHSVRCDSPIFHTPTHLLDSGIIVMISSYLLLKYFNFNRAVLLSSIISLISIYTDYSFNSRLIKKLIIVICYFIFTYHYGIYGMIMSLIHLYFFKKNKYWDKHDFYRYSWHTSSFVIFLLMINVLY